MQSASGGGCDGGGKGALVQTEKSGTLGTVNDQTIFCMATQQGGAEIRTDDGAPTLTAAAGMSGNNQPVVCMTPWDCQSKRIFDTNGSSPTLQGGVGGGVNNPAVMCMTPWDAQSQRVYDEDGISPTLSSRENSGLNREAVLCAGFKLGNSEQARSIGYEEEKSPTLNAECGGNKPAVVAPTCLDMSHACDVIRDCGEQAPALQARMGTGGNQIPLTYGIGNGQVNDGAAMTEEVSQTLNTMHDAQAVVCEDVSHALRAKANCAYREDAETYPVQNMVVRRLTPLECTRLQGYPEFMEMNIEEMTKDEYIAANIASGQIVVDCENGKIYTTKGPGGKRLSEPRLLAGTNVNGYRVVSIRNGDTKLQCRVHRVVWIAKNGIIPEGYVIDHINNDKADNRISNLQLLTPEENSHKAHRDGRYLVGDDNPSTKLPVSKRKEVVELYRSGEMTTKELSEKYGICKSRVQQIVSTYGWVDIGDWVDEKGKKHKDADSPKYKALGNSIALPFWEWMLRRMARYMPEGATLGSLFDGIGGFPLVFERIHGKGTARWASEIEQFPIVVTKKWFGEE